jgi:rRNA-processing protein FCF1
MSKIILLDTNFIINCVRNKIDFLNELYLKGFEILIPEEVIKEIEKISESKQKLKEKEISSLCLEILKVQKSKFKKIKLNSKNVDNGIIDFALKNKGVIIATLDNEIKKKLKKKNNILSLRNKNKLEIVG